MLKNMKNEKAFTIIELLVVMAIIGVLVLLAIPKFMGYTQQARATEIKSNTKQLENASERYYIDKQDWPRLSDTPYTADQITSFAQEITDKTGQIITLDTAGSYYDIDYTKLQQYMQKPKNNTHYIIQNPVGEVYSLSKLTDIGKNALDNVPLPNSKPTAVITMTPNQTLTTATNIVWNYTSSTDPDGDTIINSEWQGKQDNYSTSGNYTVNLRVKDSKGLWSDWVSTTFIINEIPTPASLSFFVNGVPYAPGKSDITTPIKTITWQGDTSFLGGRTIDLDIRLTAEHYSTSDWSDNLIIEYYKNGVKTYTSTAIGGGTGYASLSVDVSTIDSIKLTHVKNYTPTYANEGTIVTYEYVSKISCTTDDLKPINFYVNNQSFVAGNPGHINIDQVITWQGNTAFLTGRSVEFMIYGANEQYQTSSWSDTVLMEYYKNGVKTYSANIGDYGVLPIDITSIDSIKLIHVKNYNPMYANQGVISSYQYVSKIRYKYVY